MKKNSCLALCLFALLGIPVTAGASEHILGASVTSDVGSGSLGATTEMALGAGLSYQLVTANRRWGFSLSHDRHTFQSDAGAIGDDRSFQLRVRATLMGVQRFFNEEHSIRPFAGLAAGVGDWMHSWRAGGASDALGSSGLALSANAGVRFDLGRLFALDLAGRTETIFTGSQRYADRFTTNAIKSLGLTMMVSARF